MRHQAETSTFRQVIGAILIAAFVAMFASCTNETVSYAIDSEELILTNGADVRSTKASSSDILVKAYTFDANTSASAKSYFTDLYTQSGSLYISNTSKFWPESMYVSANSRLSVFAVTPSTITLNDASYLTASSNNLPTFSYTVALNAAAQEDVKVAKTVAQSVESQVVLNMNSVLSTINVNLKGAQAGQGTTVYTINSVTIRGAYADGEYDFNSSRMQIAENAETQDFILPVSTEWTNREVSADDTFAAASEYAFHMIPQSATEIVVDYTVEYNGYVIFRGTQVEQLNGFWSQNKTYNYDIELNHGGERIDYNPFVAE